MWRNEQRNLEAEARVLVEQLRDLVASNATLRAKYVAKLRALTNTDFTMGGQVMAKWKTTNGWHAAVVTKLTDEEVTIRYKTAHGRNASTLPSATMCRDKGRVFTERPRHGKKRIALSTKIAEARAAIAAIDVGDLPAIETRLRRDAVERSKSVRAQLAAIAQDSEHHSETGAHAPSGRAPRTRAAPATAAPPPAAPATVLEGEDGRVPDDTEEGDESELDVVRGFRPAEVERLHKEVLNILKRDPQRLREQQVFTSPSLLSRGLTSVNDLCVATIRVYDLELQHGTELVKTPCAICGSCAGVTRHGFVPSLRTVYGLTGTLYLMGSLYRCASCKKKKTTQAKVVAKLGASQSADLARETKKLKTMHYTFRSWDPRVEELLWASTPWAVVNCPVSVSHRAASTTELLDHIESFRVSGVAMQRIGSNLEASYDITKDRRMAAAMLYEESAADDGLGAEAWCFQV